MAKLIAKTLVLAQAQSRRGYTISLDQFATLIKVSTRWIKDVILPQINHTEYRLSGKEFITFSLSLDYYGNKMHNGIYLNKDEINDFIKSKCRVEAQTEIIDMYSYLEGNPKKRKEIYNLYKEKYDDQLTGFARLPRSVINEINKNYHKKIANLSPTQLKHKDKEYGDYYPVEKSGRSDTRCPEVPYLDKEKIDIFKDELYFPKEDLNDGNKVIKAGEHIYRYAYLHGDIKVKIGDKKAFFIKNNRDYTKYKMPFLIPYNTKMSRY